MNIATSLFFKLRKYITREIKSNEGTCKYCSKDCQKKALKIGKVYKCANCNTEIYKSPGEMKNNVNAFCSKSCAAIYNNSHNADRRFGPERKTKCKYCSNIIGHERKVCDECKLLNETQRKIKTIEKLKIEEELSKQICKVCGKSTRGHGDLCITHKAMKIDEQTLSDLKCEIGIKSNRYSAIRTRARTIAKSNGMLKHCEVCGYSKIVAACHIKPISLFPLDTKISKINLLSNLIGLCPNHHYEMDHKLLSSEDKQKIDEIISKREKAIINSNDKLIIANEVK